MTTINQTIEVPTADLNTYITNPRIGNTTEIAKSLTISGQYRAIVVNKGTHTGRPMEVLAGNHTLMAARDLGWDTITAHIVDVDNDQAARIVLADNRTADLGTYDNDVLASLLDDLPDLDGTGYTPEDLDLLTDHTSGPLSLDDLADEYGEFTDDDLLKPLALRITASTLTKWNNHRATTSSDDEALDKLL